MVILAYVTGCPDSPKPSSDFSNLALLQASTALAPNQLKARVRKLESAVIKRAPVRYLLVPHKSDDFSPSGMTSNESISCHSSDFASDVVREMTFNFFVGPLKSPTRRNDNTDVGIANGLDKQGHLAKVIGRLGLARVQSTIKVKK